MFIAIRAIKSCHCKNGTVKVSIIDLHTISFSLLLLFITALRTELSVGMEPDVMPNGQIGAHFGTQPLGEHHAPSEIDSRSEIYICYLLNTHRKQKQN